MEQKILEEFVASLETYSIIPQSYQELYRRKASLVTDPAKKRELKIKQYKQEKELRATIEVHSFLYICPLFHSPNSVLYISDDDFHPSNQATLQDSNLSPLFCRIMTLPQKTRTKTKILKQIASSGKLPSFCSGWHMYNPTLS
jgi:hypothetical protein